MNNRAIFAGIFLFILLGIGTFTYSYLENWSYIDSLYFSAITLTTIGYGDLAPTTSLSKLFTVGYAFLGVGVVLFIVGTTIKDIILYQEKKFVKKISRLRKK